MMHIHFYKVLRVLMLCLFQRCLSQGSYDTQQDLKDFEAAVRPGGHVVFVEFAALLTALQPHIGWPNLDNF